MYKSGIWRLEDLRRIRTLAGTHRALSYALLNMPKAPTQEDIARFELVIKGVRLSFGIWRTTYPSRFDDIDEAVQGILRRLYSRSTALMLHDVAASDCQLSARWGALVRQDFEDAQLTASDLLFCLTEAVSDSCESYILEPSGEAIQYIRPPFVVTMGARESRLYPVNALVQKWGKRRLAEVARRHAGLEWQGVPDDRTIRSGGWTFSQIPLIHPRVLTEVRQGLLEVRQWDAFTTPSATFDVVRIMNLLQPLVFSRERVRSGLEAALNSLNVGGLLIAGRTIESEGQRNNATIYRKTKWGPEPLEKIGKGFEFHDLALEFRASESVI